VRRWNPADRFWQDADEPVPDEPETIPPDLSEETVSHPLFVYIEDHQPKFLRDLGL
jgi:hypothetical protein